jgi:hypothetical protein
MSVELHPSNPGQMTAVMRAAPRRAGSKVLRAAVVRGGRVLEERILPRGTSLTVGPTERSTFVVADTRVPASFALIEWSGASGGGWALHLASAMEARVSLGARAVDAGMEPIPLADAARGKITIGDTIVLFHFIDPPVPPPKPELPLAARKALFDDLDWKTTFIAAFSFLFHFGAVGAIYSDFADGVVDDEARVASVVEIIHDLPAPPQIEQRHDEAPSPDARSTADATTTKAPSAQGGRVAGARPTHGDAGQGERMSDARMRDIARQLADADGAMVLAIGVRSNKGAAGRVLEGGEVPAGMLDGVAAGAGGVAAGNVAGLHIGGDGGGAVRPGERGRGLGGVADTRADARSGDSGRAVEVKKPVGNLNLSPPSVMGSDLPDAPRVVAGMQAGLRLCYKRGLEEDPTMQGSVRVTAQVGPNGEVRSAQPSGGGGLSSGVISCVVSRVRSAQFGQPASGGATVVIPMMFRVQ